MPVIQREDLENTLNKITDRLKNLQRPENEEALLKEGQKPDKIIGLFPRDFGMGPWDWPQGVGLYGMLARYRQTGDPAVKDYLCQWFDSHLAEGLPRENINTTCPLLTLAHLADEKPEYRKLCDQWAEWLMKELPRTEEGGFQHTTTKDAGKGLLNMNENQIWIDTLFMSVLFLAKWGVTANRKDYIDEAVHQFLIMVKYLYEKKTGLFYHAWSFSERSNFGGVFWCRGNCWYTAACMDFMEILGDWLDSSVRQILTDTYKAQVRALYHLQAADGLWHTVLDDPDSYEETSGSAGILYGVLKGLHMGVLPADYEEMAVRGIRAVIKQVEQDGTVTGVSAGTPVGKDREHYKRIMTAPMAYGQSLCMMALSEALNQR